MVDPKLLSALPEIATDKGRLLLVPNFVLGRVHEFQSRRRTPEAKGAPY